MTSGRLVPASIKGRIFRGSAIAGAVALMAACSPAETGSTGGSGGTTTSSGGSFGSGTGGSTGSGGTPRTGGSSGSGGQAGGASGGSTGTGGSAATGGTTGTGGSGSGGTPASNDGGGRGGSSGDAGGGDVPVTDTSVGGDVGGGGNFSFFVISMKALQTISAKPMGPGGDLRINGKTDGLAGADEYCRLAAEMGMPGAGQKTWKAFLGATKGGEGGAAINPRDRIGNGPWFDRMGRMLAPSLATLFGGNRPPAVAALANDLTNERGEPNHFVGVGGYRPGMAVDNHDTITASDAMGRFSGPTCEDWTSATATPGPKNGHSWPRSATSGLHWIADHSVPGCSPGVEDAKLGTPGSNCIGCSGGYGGFYCFATTP